MVAKAYIIAELTVPDPQAYAGSGYPQMAQAAIAAHDGRFLVRGGPARVLEGHPQPDRIVVIEFPSRAAAEAFYHSHDYAPAIALRQTLSSGRLVLLDGYEPG